MNDITKAEGLISLADKVLPATRRLLTCHSGEGDRRSPATAPFAQGRSICYRIRVSRPLSTMAGTTLTSTAPTGVGLSTGKDHKGRLGAAWWTGSTSPCFYHLGRWPARAISARWSGRGEASDLDRATHDRLVGLLDAR